MSSNFQTILVSIFLAFFVFAVLIFSGYIKLGGSSTSSVLKGRIVIWGVFPSSDLLTTFAPISKINKDLKINYVQKNIFSYQQDLIEAFANGKGPDLFIITPDMIQENSNFISRIPYASYPEKIFKDSFINGADIYLDNEGTIGFPLVVDPMVLYYNKDILSNEGIVYPPKTWDELFVLNPTLTKRDNIGVISQSMIAFGQYDNVNNVKDILATLLIQNGNPIVSRDSSGGYFSLLNNKTIGSSATTIDEVIAFFLEFSNISNSSYSWNRSLSNSLDMFTSSKLVFYIGKTSELFKIQSMNPNLSFDVTSIPQIKDSATKLTYGDIYAVVVNKKSNNLVLANQVSAMLVTGDVANNFSTAVSLPPASRALLSVKPSNPYLFSFFNSALISRSWLDPNKAKSNLIFRELIENILSNSTSTREAINKAQGQLQLLLNKK